MKAAQINKQHSLIQELILYEFKLGYNVIETTKNIYTKLEGVVDYNTVTRLLKSILFTGCKDPDDQARSSKPKTMNYDAVLQATETNPVSST